MSTVRSTASVATDRPGRYGKQLVSHLSRRLPGTWSEEAGGGTIELSDGLATLAAADGALDLSIDAPAESLDRWEDVLGRHLVRFGARDELVVQWSRSDGTAGQMFRNDDEPEPEHVRPS